uniref:ATPase n=1 Tax=Heterorhabditis bacteriophora TaxID=37862 RepID=A0A1I7WPY9_HETBA
MNSIKPVREVAHQRDSFDAYNRSAWRNKYGISIVFGHCSMGKELIMRRLVNDRTSECFQHVGYNINIAFLNHTNEKQRRLE